MTDFMCAGLLSTYTNKIFIMIPIYIRPVNI